MKEFVAETGGRYTYVDDILNLQELALSMSSIFDDCSNFIISGCEKIDSSITPGYVWINGKVRYFEGGTSSTDKYYLYEQNTIDSVVYANEENKKGRINYLCIGGPVKPDGTDPVTGELSQYIEITPNYSPRFLDKFVGKYALLLDGPHTKQTVNKDLVVTGKFSVDKTIDSKTAISVINPDTGYTLKHIVKPNNDGSIGMYSNGLILNEILIQTDGTFILMHAGNEILKINPGGIECKRVSTDQVVAGKISISGPCIDNYTDDSDEGSVNINYRGYKGGNSTFRNFNVYGGKEGELPLLHVSGQSNEVMTNGRIVVSNRLSKPLNSIIPHSTIELYNPFYERLDKQLLNAITWSDKTRARIAEIGYTSSNNVDFYITNCTKNGNMVISPNLSSDGTLSIHGKLSILGLGNVATVFLKKTDFNIEHAKKVDKVDGKQLSTEDFTTSLKNKLTDLHSSAVGTDGVGYTTAKDVTAALKKKLTLSENLSDVPDKGKARQALNVYSIDEGDKTFLKVSSKLTELITFSEEETKDLTPEQIAALKVTRQKELRDTLDAEKKGTGELKLAKTSNLSDLPDKGVARKNISVYSVAEVDSLLKNKLDASLVYKGEIFTTALKNKLEGITTGHFAYTDSEGVSQAQKEGYVTTSQVKAELDKKARYLLDGYSAADKTTIAGNIGVYTISAADGKFAGLSSNFQDYINKIVSTGKTTAEAQKVLRDNLDVPSKSDVSSSYLSKTGGLSDLSLANDTAKRNACRVLGAAYASDYQIKLIDSGWIQMVNYSTSNDTRTLFVRQIGNVVSIQGKINTAKRSGSNWGGIVAMLPASISPPQFAVRTSACHYNDGHKYNRGASFVMNAKSRYIYIYESGMYNENVEINFTYMI